MIGLCIGINPRLAGTVCVFCIEVARSFNLEGLLYKCTNLMECIYMYIYMYIHSIDWLALWRVALVSLTLTMKYLLNTYLST